MLAVNGRRGDVPIPSQSLNQNPTRTTNVDAARDHRTESANALPLQKLWTSLCRSCRRNMGQWAIARCVRSMWQVGCLRTPACDVRHTTFAGTVDLSIRTSVCTTIGGLFPRSRHIGTLSLCSSRTDSSCPDWGSNFKVFASPVGIPRERLLSSLASLLCLHKVSKYSALPEIEQGQDLENDATVTRRASGCEPRRPQRCPRRI